MRPQDRYLQDEAFRVLVDLLESFIHKSQYTPSELREAAILAAIHYEYTRPAPPRMVVPPGCELAPLACQGTPHRPAENLDSPPDDKTKNQD